MRDLIFSVVETLEQRRLLVGSPVLVGDINQTTDQLSPMSALQVGNIAYFSGRQSAADGQELFKTDGTTAGTVLVKDIDPTTGSDPQNLTNVNGTLYFVADDGTSGGELWKSDGTAAGTVMVKDINPGSATSASSRPIPMAAVNDRLYFMATDGSGNALWTSDGTVAGTVKVTLAGSSSALAAPNSMTAYNGALLVGAGSSSSAALYRVTGSTATLVSSTPKDPRNLTVFNGYAYFSVGTNATDTTRGDLWRTDGTAAGTTLVKAINFLSSSTDYASEAAFTVSGDRLFFIAGSFINGTYNLWSTDGTPANTIALTTGSSLYTYDTLTPIGTRSVLFGNTATATGHEPWISDSTVAGTKLLKDIAPGTEGSGVSGGVRLGDGRVLFDYRPANTTNDFLYTTDGTANNTVAFLSAAALSASPVANVLYPIGTLNGIALLAGIRTFTDGDLYRSDGTNAGTYRLGATLPANSSGLSDYRTGVTTDTIFPVGNTVYFAATDGTTGMELYKSVAGATPVRLTDLAPGGDDSTPDNFTLAADGSIYFTASVFSFGPRSIFRLTPSGTVTPIAFTTTSAPNFSNLTAVGSQLYYTVSGGTLTRPQLRFFNPVNGSTGAVTIAGSALTSPTKIVRAGNAYSFGAQPMDVNGTVTAVQRLYRVTGDDNAVPVAVTDIASGSSATTVPAPIGAIGDTVFFAVGTAATGLELWKSDGTAAGTVDVADMTPGTGSTDFNTYSTLQNMTLASGGYLYFTADTGSGDYVAWRTDGTAAGTIPLTGSGTTPNNFLESAGQVYFLAATPGGTNAIYRVDGTTATAVTSAGTGNTAFNPTRFFATGNAIYALGIAGNRARFELWRADASLGGYGKLLVLAPRVDPIVGGTLSGFFVLGRYAAATTGTDLYFPRYEPATGVELHRLSLATTGSISGVVFDDTNADGVRQLSENPLAGETVYLDLNGNAQLDAGEPTAVSTSAGYMFTGVNTGTYTVRLQTPIGGRRTTTPGVSASVTVSEGATATAATPFGVTSLTGTAVIGGPKTVAEGSAITLDGSASSEPFGTITKYEWDFNYTGASFEVDATGAAPTFDAGQIDGPARRGIGLRVTDANGLVSFVTKAIIDITNVAPTARLLNGGPVTLGSATTATFRGLNDPAAADLTAPLYSFDFNNDGDFIDAGDISDASSFAASFTYAAAGTYTVHGRVADKDGGFNDYYTTVVVAPVPTTTSTDPASTLLEGESAAFAGGTAKASGNGGYTGTGYADFGGINSSAQWSLARNGAGRVTLSFRYANGGTTDRPLAIMVNGTVIGSVACAATGSWTTWTTVTLAANLIAGANTIKATASASAGGANVDSLTVLSQPAAPPAWLSLGSGASYTLSGNTLTVSGGTATLLSDAGATHPGLSIIVSSGAAVVANTTQHLGALGIVGTFTMTAGGGKVLRVTALSQSPGAALNLNDNDLIIDYAATNSGVTPTPELRNWIATARAGGAWNAAGVRSASAAGNPAFTLGYMDAADYFAINGSAAKFDGETIDATTVLVKYTLSGDANLDGRVDFNDFLRLQNNFNTANAGFAGGDFDYDGKADFNDFLALQNNFGQTLPQRPVPSKIVKR